MTANESNAHKCPPIPEGLARGTLLLLEKKLSKFGLSFDCKAYIGETGTQCIQVYVDNIDDPNDHEDFYYDVTTVKSPAELFAQVREDLSEIYDL